MCISTFNHSHLIFLSLLVLHGMIWGDFRQVLKKPLRIYQYLKICLCCKKGMFTKVMYYSMYWNTSPGQVHVLQTLPIIPFWNFKHAHLYKSNKKKKNFSLHILYVKVLKVMDLKWMGIDVNLFNKKQPSIFISN